jgi:hypothetical protein
MTTADQPFKPRGAPLTAEQLKALALITQSDVDKAIAMAHPSIKPYLEAPQR